MTERDNELAIARLQGELKAVRAEMESTQSKIDASLSLLRKDTANMRAEMAQRDAEASKRELRLILTVAALIAAATTILGFLIRMPSVG